jgi:hypothetical protein
MCAKCAPVGCFGWNGATKDDEKKPGRARSERSELPTSSRNRIIDLMLQNKVTLAVNQVEVNLVPSTRDPAVPGAEPHQGRALFRQDVYLSMLSRGVRVVLAVAWMLAVSVTFCATAMSTNSDHRCRGEDRYGHRGMHHDPSGKAMGTGQGRDCSHCPRSQCMDHAQCGATVALALATLPELVVEHSTPDRILETRPALHSRAHRPPTPPPQVLS